MESQENVRPYQLRISRTTVDKLGVKLYDKVSAVVAELIANGYDADAETVHVKLPLAIMLATKDGNATDKGFIVEVEDDGHGMTPDEAIDYFLLVGSDRRKRLHDGAISRIKQRPVMGRKGIGKLAPFGICRRIEVWSAGGERTPSGYKISHFILDYDRIVTEDDSPVELDRGSEDRTWSERTGTRIRLSEFLPKRVPDETTFIRQLAVRFTFSKPDFSIFVQDSLKTNHKVKVDPLDIPLLPNSRIDLSSRPVIGEDGKALKVAGWLGMAKEAYKNEEMMGVRIYARGKIIGVTRDFNQPAGFTGEFATRSYLVGVVEAEWLDLDDDEDLVRTDRQDILWSSEKGQLLRNWGADLIREIGRLAKEPRRTRVRDVFLKKANLQEKAQGRYRDKSVSKVAVELGSKFGAFAAEDELEDDDYINDLCEIILSVAPHQALIEAFQELTSKTGQGQDSLKDFSVVVEKARIAELASYAQIAAERVRVIKELERIVKAAPDEAEFQKLLSKAEWLIEPTWSVITKNQGLKTFKDLFEAYWLKRTGSPTTLAIGYEKKRPDFTLVSIDGMLHIVEIKKASHDFDDLDFGRLNNYFDAFEDFFQQNPIIKSEFPRGWKVNLVADGEALSSANRKALQSVLIAGNFDRISWQDFLLRAKKVHERFLDAHDSAHEPDAD